ncbi:MAG: DUF1587 domain-containing protein, partial [Verrucomicrobiota bacterium]
MPSRTSIPLCTAALVLFGSMVSGLGAPPPDWAPFLASHCYDCHDDDVSKSDLNLADLPFDPARPSNFGTWARVFERVESGEMPPKKKPRPEAQMKKAFLAGLEAPLLAADLAEKEARGRVRVRRLTRREYEHTIHDLLGVDLPLKELLPEDPATHGFETVASGQPFSHFNLSSYLGAADLALDEAFKRAIRGDETFSKSFGAARLGRAGAGRGNFRGPETRDNLSISWPIRQQFYGRMPATRVPESGWYRITLKDLHAINPKSGATWGTLRSGAGNSAQPMLYMIGLVEATEEKRDVRYDSWIQKDHLLELKPND